MLYFEVCLISDGVWQMSKESDFNEGMDDYKQNTDLFPHPSIADEFEKRGFLRRDILKQPTPEEQERIDKITQAANRFIATSHRIAKATKHSELVFRTQSNQNTKN